MRLDNQRHALDGCGIRARPALGQSRRNQTFEVSESCDSLAIPTFTAKVVTEALAIGRLREHAREREFAHSARAGKQHGMRHASASEQTPEHGDNFFVTYEFRKWHFGLQGGPSDHQWFDCHQHQPVNFVL
jgi:hypothetical protein